MIEPKGYADKNGAMQKFYAAARAYRKAYDRLGLIEHLPSHELRVDQAAKDRFKQDRSSLGRPSSPKRLGISMRA